MLFTCASLSILAITFHLSYLTKHEHHLQAPQWALLFIFSILMVPLYLQVRERTLSWAHTLATTLQILASFYVPLFTSITVYRLWFHSLRHFPGPRLAAASKLYHVWKVSSKLDSYRFLDRLHHKYGDVVRTGPNEVALFSPDAVEVIHGSNSRCTRGPFYDGLLPIKSVFTTRSKSSHEWRRQIWSQGFSIRSLQLHEPSILHCAAKLVEHLTDRVGQVCDATHICECFALEVVGQLAKESIFGLGALAIAPWTMHLALSIPGISAGMARMYSWIEQNMRRRLDDDTTPKVDTLNHLLGEAKNSGKVDEEWRWLIGDCLLMYQGGFDPVSSPLTFCCYYIARDPELASKLLVEIRQAESIHMGKEGRLLQPQRLLDAIIWESLRLNPVVRSGGVRVTPSEGIRVGDVYIPGGVSVVIPQYSLHRREDCFVKADEFIPERWTTRSDLVKNKTAFMAWGIGPYSCIGKNMGLMEIRAALISIVTRFRMTLAPGEDGATLLNQSQDCFANVPGKLRLVFAERK